MMMEQWEGEEEGWWSRGSFRSSEARCPGLPFRHGGEEGGGLCIFPVQADHRTCAASDV